MSAILILYSTVDGHTEKICRRLQELAAAGGHTVSLRELGSNLEIDLERFDTVVVGASIRYGRHRPYVSEFLRMRRAELQGKRCAFFSVNIVARKSEKSRPATNPYMLKLLRQIGWRPPLLAVFAGRLDYPRYTFWDRLIIRFIMLLTRGPTDPAASIDFTNWSQVDAFAAQICATGGAPVATAR